MGSPTAAAARSRRDDDGADRDWIGSRNENGAAAAPTDAAPGIGIIGGGKVQADRKRQHGGETRHNFHLGTPLGLTPLLALGRQRKVTRSYGPQVSVGLMCAG